MNPNKIQREEAFEKTVMVLVNFQRFFNDAFITAQFPMYTFGGIAMNHAFMQK